ncbi:MAG: hypothetical protein GY733_11425, partial [bacterium]|nr:hypothetical protein [bacterium]
FVWKGDEHLYVGVYVDDIMVVHSDSEAPAFHEFKRAFFARWQAEDEGEMADLLNVHIRRGDGCITLHQEPYIRGMVRRFAPDGFPSDLPRTSTPSDAHLAQTVADAQAADITTDAALTNRFQTLVGALLYAATHTRPDIAYAVGMLCRVMSRSTPALYAYAMVVLRYLDRNAAIGLRYTSVPTTLEGYFDANWDVLRPSCAPPPAGSSRGSPRSSPTAPSRKRASLPPPPTLRSSPPPRPPRTSSTTARNSPNSSTPRSRPHCCTATTRRRTTSPTTRSSTSARSTSRAATSTSAK